MFSEIESRFSCLDLTETKLKGFIVWGKWHHCPFSGDLESKGRCDRPVERCMTQCGDKLGCVSSRILWIKFKFSKLKFKWCWDMAPLKGKVKEGRGLRMTCTGLWIK